MQPYYDDGQIQIWHADCRDVLPTLDAGSIDLVLTDPPYGIKPGALFWRENGRVLTDATADSFNVAVDGWRSLLPLAPSAAIVEFCDGAVAAMEAVVAAHRAAQWTIWRWYMLVKATPPPTPRKTMVSGWESALISYVGQRPWYGSGYAIDTCIARSPGQDNDKRLHPAQKSLKPFLALTEALSGPDALICDPFAGSGTVGVAAKQTGRRCILIEQEERYCELAVRRLAQQVLPLTLDEAERVSAD